MTQQVSDLGGVNFDLDVPLILLWHINQKPKQNRSESGTSKIKLNPTQVRDLLGHPVLIILTIPLQTKAATRRNAAAAPALAEAASATTEAAPATTTIPGT